MSENQREIYIAVITTSVIFLLIACGLIMLVLIYNRRKQKHIEEKAAMQNAFGAELIKTQYEVQEQTLQTIGAELHDNIGQLLSLTSLTLGSIEIEQDGKIKQKIDTAITLTNNSIKEMRMLGRLLQGENLIGQGLANAVLQELQWLEKSGRFEISYQIEKHWPESGNADKDLFIFRIIQEIINNIIKHAFCTRISIKLELKQGVLNLIVEDNGVGFDPGTQQEDKNGMGLQNINRRAAMIGGSAEIYSMPGKGTSITLFIPYP